MTGFFNDLRQSWRSLRRTPSFTLAAVLTLALGIGAIGAVYSVGNGLLWRPLAAPGADRLAVIYAQRDQVYDDLSWRDYLDLRASTGKTFDDLIAYGAMPVSLGHAGAAERVWGEMVSDNYFTMLGGQPVAGRLFRDGVTDGPPGIVISEAFWQARFNREASVIGTTVKLNGQQFTVLGVVSQAFRSPFYIGFSPALWLRTADYGVLEPGRVDRLMLRGEEEVRIMGRIREGVSLAAAQAALASAVQPLEAQYPAGRRPFTGALIPERNARPEPEMAGSMQLAFLLFLAVAGGVLIIACANVASLLLARAIARRREITVRLALGAGRGRLIRQLVTESLVLAALGGAAGGLVATWMTAGVSGLLRFSTDIPFIFDFSADRRVIGFTVAVTVVTTFLFGLVPALQATSPSLQQALRGDAPRGAASTRLFATLVAAQIAVSCLLLVGAGLVVRTLGVMAEVSPGFTVDQRLLVSVAPGLQGYDDTRARQLYTRLASDLAALPGVRGVTIADDVPLDFTSNSAQVLADGVETQGKGGVAVGLTVVGSEYFGVMDTRLLEGRDFAPGDTVGAPRVAIVSRAMVEQLWGSQPALGRVFRLGGPEGDPVTVIGVAADAKYRGLAEANQPHAYFPLQQDPPGSATIVLATGADPFALTASVRAAIAAADPDVPIASVRSYRDLLLGRSLLMPSIAARVTTAMGGLALLLSLIGLYGVISYRVAQRRRELGIRMALGATNASVVRLMLRDGVRLAAWGIVAGTVSAMIVTRFARTLLFGVSPTDPLVLSVVILTLIGVTLLASWLPARRAARVDPVLAMRGE